MITLFLTLALAEDPSPFTCCDDPVIERVVEAWLDAGEALHEGKPHVPPLDKLARAAEGSGKGDDRDALDRIAKEAKALAARSLAEAREGVQPLAQDVLWLSLRHEGGSVDVVQATCPGQGSWLQRKSKRVRNPSGHRCGSFR